MLMESMLLFFIVIVLLCERKFSYENKMYVIYGYLSGLSAFCYATLPLQDDTVHCCVYLQQHG